MKTLFAAVLALLFAAPALADGPVVNSVKPPTLSTIKLEGKLRKGRVVTGSGVHLGYGATLTAAHVLEGIRGSATAILDNGVKLATQTLWVNSEYDVALVQLRAYEGLPSSPLSCVDPAVGTKIEAVGNPFDLMFAHTWGRVSGAPQAQPPHWKLVYPADLTLGAGMSGGPAFDEAGNIAGLNVGKFVDANISLMVPPSILCAMLARGVEH